MTYADPRQNASGEWLCTVTAKCNAKAVAQSSYACAGCDEVVESHAAQLEQLTAERDQHNRALELIRVELARRADAGEPGGLTAVEDVAMRLGMDRVKQLGEDIARLAAAHAAVLGEHTHPVFACSKHVARLPEPPA